MASQQFERFKSTLRELFMLDQADLDFGIYRIMNQKRRDVENYLNHRLPAQVKELLEQNASNRSADLQKQLREAITQAQNLGVDPDSLPKVKELRKAIAQQGSAYELENIVYSHLATFFSRYYEGGDFISLRRYKKDVYAIPYEGEEVKLHWANADQYYIKTGEYFRRYSFRLDDGKTVEFTLKDATTEQNNNLAQNNMERRFALYEGCPVEVDGDTLHINFTYELYPKSTKQKKLIEDAYNKVKDLIPQEYMSVFAPRPTDKDRGRTLLQKHLNDYVAKNTFDYFIHKNLRGFLSRELDFYIKNEILFIDDINSRSTEEFLQHLTVIKAIKAVGQSLIDFLAQLEEFQKRLWLKKKFVVQADWCMTLDRVPRELYAEICDNDAQREEWVRLFAINEIKADIQHQAAYSTPITERFLEENQFLVLDTALYDCAFKHRLLSSMMNICEQTDGLIINSENFQALQLLQEKYQNSLVGIITDPPYNTGDDDFLYKDNYEHSSWLSMMNDRLNILYSLQANDTFMSLNINDKEIFNLWSLLDNYQWSTKTNITVKMSHLSGMKMSHIDKKIPKIKESIIVLSKGNKFTYSPIYEQCTWDEAFPRYTAWLDKNGSDDPSDWTHTSLRNAAIQRGVDVTNEVDYNSFKIRHADFIYQRAKNDSFNNYPHDDTFRIVNTATGLSKVVLDAKEVLFAGSYLQEIDGQLTPVVPKGDIWTDIGINNVHNEGGVQLPNGKKPVKLFERLVYLFNQTTGYILDPFAGSSTLAHAVINSNKTKGTSLKYILIQEGYNYFNDKTKRRIENVIYSSDWKLDKPVSREGSSHCFKYMRLEQYEDTLNNLTIAPRQTSTEGQFADGFLIGYMLDVETRDSLLNLQWFVNPFDVRLNITRQNETIEERIDLPETFNYLIGLYVKQMSWPKSGIMVVEGTTRTGKKTLVIWRDCNRIDNATLNSFFKKSAYSVRDNEFDIIYVNGDNNLENLRTDEDTWKVTLIEQEFNRKMFE